MSTTLIQIAKRNAYAILADNAEELNRVAAILHAASKVARPTDFSHGLTLLTAEKYCERVLEAILVIRADQHDAMKEPKA